MREELWIATVHVKPKAKNSALSKQARGAYANALAFAHGIRDFQAKLKKEADEYGLSLVDIEDAAPFERWCEANDVPDELRTLADSIERRDQVFFDAFYEYLADDEIQ